jgi:hypothetical protein
MKPAIATMTSGISFTPQAARHCLERLSAKRSDACLIAARQAPLVKARKTMI